MGRKELNNQTFLSGEKTFFAHACAREQAKGRNKSQSAISHRHTERMGPELVPKVRAGRSQGVLEEEALAKKGE